MVFIVHNSGNLWDFGVILYSTIDMVVTVRVYDTQWYSYVITAKTTTATLQSQYGRLLLLTWLAAMFDFSDMTACILFSSNSLFCCLFSASRWCILNEMGTIAKHVNAHTQSREKNKFAMTAWDGNFQLSWATLNWINITIRNAWFSMITTVLTATW